MKNLYLLPTNNPSRLVKFFTNKFHLCKEILPIQDEEQYHQVYIISNEEIKEGDWRLDIRNGDVYKSNKNDSELYDNTYRKKIILTTNKLLIEDGIQEISEDFLEWFVKNPTCESVELKPWFNEILSCCKSESECSCNKKRIVLPNNN